MPRPAADPDMEPICVGRVDSLQENPSRADIKKASTFPISPVSDEASIVKRLHTLLDTVRHNERVLQRFQHIELRIVSAPDFSSFYDMLAQDFAQAFDLPFVSLWLNEDLPLIREMLDGLSRSALGDGMLHRGGLEAVTAAIPGGGGGPWLGLGAQLGAAACTAFFDEAEIPVSVAVLPLFDGEAVSGYLCLGSHDPERFTDGKATDLLERFATFVGAGVVNVAHREQISRHGLTDSLTNLPNRRYFDTRLHEEVERSTEAKTSMACLFIDADHFKQINDRYGHLVGDRVLAAIGACIRSAVRQTDTVARYGGEEFIVLVRGDAALAWTVAERIRSAVEALVVVDSDGNPVQVTVSIGVAACNMDQIPHEEGGAGRLLVESADHALYVAKHGGRNRVAVHRLDME